MTRLVLVLELAVVLVLGIGVWHMDASTADVFFGRHGLPSVVRPQ